MRNRTRSNRVGVVGGSGRSSGDINRTNTKYESGDYLVTCDTTGQVVLRSETKLNWRGVLQRLSTFDPKHPQLEIYGRDEEISVENPRPTSDNDDDLNFGEGNKDDL